MKKSKVLYRFIALLAVLLLLFQTSGVGLVTAFAEAHENGASIGIGKLKVGDFVESGVTLYPRKENQTGLFSAEVYIDGSLAAKIGTGRGYSAKYTTNRLLRVERIEESVYSRNSACYYLTGYDEAEYNAQKAYRAEHYRYVNTLKLGEILTDQSELHLPEKNSPYDFFKVYLDGDEKYHIVCDTSFYDKFYTPTSLVRVVGLSADPENSRKFRIYLETIYELSEVRTEVSLRIMIQEEGKVKLMTDMELTGRLNFDDGLNHVLDLNGYTLSRNLTGRVWDGQVIYVGPGTTLTLIDSSEEGAGTITGGKADEGGGILAEGTLYLQSGNIVKNEAGYGGGLFVGGTAVVSKEAVIEENTADYGGGISVKDTGNAAVDACSIQFNHASLNGGGVYNKGTLTMTGTPVMYNTATTGAGICSDAGSTTLKQVQIMQNSNASLGGGIYAGGAVTLDSCVISGNTASGYGGGIQVAYRNPNVTFVGENSICENSAKEGGGIHFETDEGTSFSLENVTLEGNVARESGGGIYFCSTGELILKNTVITSNDSGGIYMYRGSVVLAGGKIQVKGNVSGISNNNISFYEFTPVKITGKLTEGSKIGISTPDEKAAVTVTEGYKAYNDQEITKFFYCDNEVCKIDPSPEAEDVTLVPKVSPSSSSYKIRVTVTVTNDADWWDDAYLYIYVRDNNGLGSERLHATSPNFCTSIDESDGYYEYTVDCGTSFPSAVTFRTQFGSPITSRDFEADVKIYINDINCGSTHCVHSVFGTEIRKTNIKIGGDKYPYPDMTVVQADAILPDDKTTNYVTLLAVDQYGVTWTNGYYSMESMSFPENDTFMDVDGTGMKWRFDTNLPRDHYSEYELTMQSGSNVYPTIKTTITVHFAYPLSLTIMVDDNVVFTYMGKADEQLTIGTDFPCPEGFYISSYKANGTCFLSANKDENNKTDGTYFFAFVKDDVVLTAVTKGIRYTIDFVKNGDPLTNSADVKCTMTTKTLTYVKETSEGTALPRNCFIRSGYTFAGWNTKPDGSGTAYANMAKVKNLTTVAGEKLCLYAQWTPVASNTTASIFSEGNLAMIIGGALMLLAVIASIIYAKKRKAQALA